MRLLNRLEHRFGRFAIQRLTLLIMVGQGVAWFLGQNDREFLVGLKLVPDKVLDGEYWRLLTFLFNPPDVTIFFFFFYMLIFHLMGTSLEQTWGAFRYNVYLFVGYVVTVGVSFVVPEFRGHEVANSYLYGTVFLAFAWLYPNFVFHIMFILPVKVKWLAWLTWAIYIYSFIKGHNLARLMIAAGVANFLLFFGRDIYEKIRTRQHRIKRKVESVATVGGRGKPFHQCRTCGVTDQDESQLEFRYCSQCGDNACYCENHIRDHEHVSNE